MTQSYIREITYCFPKSAKVQARLLPPDPTVTAAPVPYDRTNRMLMASSMGVPTGRPVQRLSMSSRDSVATSEMTRMLKESNSELERVMKKNERLTAENANYAQVLEGFMEAQDTEQERNRAAAIEVANEWNADTFPFQTEPQQSYESSPQRKRTRASSYQTEQQQQSYASSPGRKRTRASSYQTEQQQMGSACPTLMSSSRGRHTATTTTLSDQKVRLT